MAGLEIEKTEVRIKRQSAKEFQDLIAWHHEHPFIILV
jgi:hypothetical protein